MLISLLFIGATFFVIVGGLVFVGRGRRGQRITGPRDRPIDYENPYGMGKYFFTNKRRR